MKLKVFSSPGKNIRLTPFIYSLLMTKVVLDTNALLMPFQFSLNLDEEIQRLVGDVDIYVPSSVMEELRAMDKKAPLQLAEKYQKIDVEKKRDEGVLEAAERLNGMIVTNDKELRNRALDRKIAVAFLRSGSHLELTGEDLLFTKRKGEDKDKKIFKLEGEVVSGVGEARFFLSLEGYKKRFREEFGFEPFEGTLNLKLKGEPLKEYQKLKEEEGILIEGFVEKGKRFSSVECFPAEVSGVYCLVIMPEKTRYERQVELVSEKKLRDELGLENGDRVQVTVEVP